MLIIACVYTKPVMADAGLTLDQIIKKRNVKPGSKMNRPGQANGRVPTEASGRFTRPGNKTFNPNRTVTSDARNKIIQNKRMKIRDARERLAEIAKQGDARDRINKIRKLNHSGPNQMKKVSKPTPPNRTNNVPLQKTVRNENRVSSLDGKTRMQGASLLRTVSGNKPNAGMNKGIPFQPRPQAPYPGRMGPGNRIGLGQQRPILIPQRTQTLANNPNVFTIKNERAKPVFRGGDIGRRPPRMIPMHMHRNPSPLPNQVRYTGFPLMDIYGIRSPSGMRSDRMDDVRLADRIRTERIEDARFDRMERLRARSLMEEEIRPTRLKITTVNTHKNIGSRYNEDEWDQPPPPPPPKVLTRKRPLYVDEAINTIASKKSGAPLSSELIARLDQPQRTGPSPGFKVIVTNLHHVVSVEDIEELFGNIGTLKSARLVRVGFAEVVFMNQEDALKSVEVYHNRQLDGQPMNVTLVAKKAPPALVAPLPSSTSTTKSILKSASGSSILDNSATMEWPLAKKIQSDDHGPSPDITTIHKALFSKGMVSTPTANQMFLVKLPKQPTKG